MKTFSNLSDILTDSFSPALILARSSTKVHYSALRHSSHFLSHLPPFCNLTPGDIACISLPTSVEFITTFFALQSVRATVNPLSTHLTLAETIAHLELVKPKVVICMHGAENLELTRNACNVFSIPLFAICQDLHFQTLQLPRVVRRLTPSVASQLSNVKPVCTMISVGVASHLDHEPTTKPHYPHSDKDVAVLLSTHGTTGTKKLVPLTHMQILEGLENTSRSLLLEPTDSTILVATLTQSHGLIGVLLASFFRGATVILPSKQYLDYFWHDAKTLGATWFSATPWQHRQIMQTSDSHQKHLQTLRFVQSTGSSLDDHQLLAMEKLYHCQIITSYTMTEACHLVASHIPRRTRKLGSVGTPAGVAVLLFDANGSRVLNAVGEICISGKSVFDGYFNDPDPARYFFEYEGKRWFRTGDNGWLDERGFLMFTGRKVDLIQLKDGGSVSPVVLDRVLSSHPALECAAFFGRNGVLEVAVVTRSGSQTTEADLRNWLQSMIPSQLPSRIYFVKTLPRTSMGKIQRHQLPLLAASKL
ncbi:hypothetical protein HDV03_004935 [Kappamyces sp. JEL0829]|nr:hypothetical protein HDV03_004935 [Kappamyces sp. JEL0829]